jgi:hypothetical protein
MKQSLSALGRTQLEGAIVLRAFRSRFTGLMLLSPITLFPGCRTTEAHTDAHTDAPSAAPVRLIADTLVSLIDDTATVLVHAVNLSVDVDQRIIVADGSDKDIKVYDRAGRRVSTIGRAGRAQGQFVSLVSGQNYRGDSVATFDFVQHRITIFGRDGRVGRTIPVDQNVHTVRVADDSLFLLIMFAGDPRALLQLDDSRGLVLARCFVRGDIYPDERLKYLSTVVADARQGRIFGAVSGDDSLFAFDYHGRQIASDRIQTDPPIETFRARWESAGHQLHRADSTWFHDQAMAVMHLVALDSGRVAVQAARYDTRNGTDLLKGAPVVVMAVYAGHMPVVANRVAPGALLGQAPDGGAPLFLGYGATQDSPLVVERWTFR